MKVVAVAVSVRAKAVDRLYDYTVSDGAEARIGDCVEVDFGNRRVEGWVIEHRVSGGAQELRPVRRVFGPEVPRLTPELLGMVRFLRERYLCSWGAAIQTVLPPAARVRERRFLSPGPGVESLPAGAAEYLRRRGPVSEAALRKRLGAEEAKVSGWIRSGAIQVVRRLDVRKPVSGRKFIRLRPEAQTKALRGSRQKDVVARLLGKVEGLDLADLMKECAAPSSVFSSLVRAGVAEVFEPADPGEIRALESPFRLTPEQRGALDAIRSQVDARAHAVFVLRGVTGSGKTEVYLHAISHILGLSLQALVLMPEIALTTQMEQRFRRRFGDRVAVLHSDLSGGDKHREWHRISRGEADVVIGARSAVFAPLQRLGLVVVDEEHEPSYKQDSEPRYLAREVAVWRAESAGAAVVLGSATPSLEAAYRADLGRYRPLFLSERVHDRPLASVRVVDMREHARTESGLFSRELREALNGRLKKGEQSLLFLNRRGFSTLLLCRDCGEAAVCPSCDIALTLHRSARGAWLRCHLCGHAEPVRSECAHCGSARIRQFGAGTQRVEHDLLEQFPGARVIRMDVDTTSEKGSHERLLGAFERGEADILLGTQMVAKGLDFSRVSLVGVIAADTSLRIPDFRAAERTFELLVQVAGRAGRHSLPGEVIVQTFSPDHYAIRAAAMQDFEAFYRIELAARREMDYPPFTEVAQFIVSHADESTARAQAERLRANLVSATQGVPGVRVLPATPALLARAKGLFRYQVVVKYRVFRAVRPHLASAYAAAVESARGRVRVTVDVNAFSLA